MEPCTVSPYSGKEKYVFVCFSHKDEYRAFSIIEALVRCGYRVWYDRGIVPGEEWPETIAEKVNGCHVFMVVRTQAADDSHNCRNEINLAVSLEKEILCLQMDSSPMSLALRMQLGRKQWLKVEEMSAEDIAGKVGTITMMKECRGEPDDSVAVIPRAKPEEAASPVRKMPGAGRPFFGQQQEEPVPGEQEQEDLPEEKIPQTRPPEEQPPTQEDAEEMLPAGDDREPSSSPPAEGEEDDRKTVLIEEEDDPNPTVRVDPNGDPRGEKPEPLPVVIRLATGESFKGLPLQTVVGREESSADVVIPSPSKSVSRSHFSVVTRSGRNYIVDMDSVNGTFVDGERLEKGKSAETGECAQVRAAEEELVVLFGNAASAFIAGAPIGILRHTAGGEYKCVFGGEPFRLGRAHPWNDRCMEDKAISRHHACIRREDDRFVLEDTSMNGTVIIRGGNAVRLKNEQEPLLNGDRVSLNGQEFEWTEVTYHGECRK